jgi:hypothetical protein
MGRLARRTGLLAAGVLAVSCTGVVAAPSLSVDGSLLRATFEDGRSLAGAALVGRQLRVPAGDRELTLRIQAVEEDRRAPGLFLYDMALQAPSGEWSPLCEPDKEGRRRAIPLAGAVSANGLFEPDARKLTLTCTSGVLGKCLRSGYLFWKPGGAVDDARLAQFQACTRLYRADYCGDGQGWTADGTLIDVYDDRGLQSPEPGSALAFEAGWTPQGAVCVHHTRVPARIGLDELRARCPRLAAAPTGPACTEATARRAGAILFNKSEVRP